MSKKTPSQFLVIGLGRLGKALTRKLFESGADVLAVDSSIADVNEAAGYSTQALCLDASNESSLTKLGVNNFDAVIVCIGAAEASIFVTLLCKQLGAKKVVAKAQNEKHRDVLEKIGADFVVFPEEDAGIKLGSMLYNPNMLEIIDLTDTYKLIEIRTPPKWSDKTLMQLDIRKQYGINIVLIKRGDKVFSSPGGDFTLKLGDLLVIGGENEDLLKLKSKATEKVEEYL